jgi:hypothetical protein
MGRRRGKTDPEAAGKSPGRDMTPADLGNAEVFLWALYTLGGETSYIDVEDVYVKCHELAPRRFSWRTKELPDYKKCAKALRDAEAREPKLLVKTGDGLKRQLSAEGQRWIHDNTDWLSSALAVGRTVPAPRQRPDSRALREVERHATFQRWLARPADRPEKWEVAELLRCATDSSIKVWRERVEVLRATAFAAENKAVLNFLGALRRSNPHWFGEGER